VETEHQATALEGRRTGDGPNAGLASYGEGSQIGSDIWRTGRGWLPGCRGLPRLPQRANTHVGGLLAVA